MIDFFDQNQAAHKGGFFVSKSWQKLPYMGLQ